jgi:hypothetical protein
MNAEIFAKWWRRQNYQVVRTPSSYWVNLGLGVFQAFPYHWQIQPSDAELTGLLKAHRGIGLRYSTYLKEPEGCISYHAVFESEAYDLNLLGSKTRRNVRRGLERCRVEPISFQRLAEEGWRIHLDTLQRQGRKVKVTPSHWTGLCQAAADLPGFTAWGAMVGSELAASVITFQMHDCGYMLFQQCLRDYLTAHVNNALIFEVTRATLGQAGIKSILYGLHSLDASPSVDEFKFRMSYEAKPVRQRVVFHPWLRPLFNGITHSLVRRLLARFPGNPILAKGEGMIRFHREGKRPLTEQSWPEALLKKKPEILASLSSPGPPGQAPISKSDPLLREVLDKMNQA